MYIDLNRERRYRVGDRIQIIDTPPQRKTVYTGIGTQRLSWWNRMSDFCGMTGTITSITAAGNYRIDTDNNTNIWCNKFFKDISFEFFDDEEDIGNPHITSLLNVFKVVE